MEHPEIQSYAAAVVRHFREMRNSRPRGIRDRNIKFSVFVRPKGPKILEVAAQNLLFLHDVGRVVEMNKPELRGIAEGHSYRESNSGNGQGQIFNIVFH